MKKERFYGKRLTIRRRFLAEGLSRVPYHCVGLTEPYTEYILQAGRLFSETDFPCNHFIQRPLKELSIGLVVAAFAEGYAHAKQCDRDRASRRRKSRKRKSNR